MTAAWQPPTTLTVHAFDLEDRVWSLVYSGPSDVDQNLHSPIVQSVMADPPGLGTWAWWYETDSAGQQGPGYCQPPVTLQGKEPPHDGEPDVPHRWADVG